MGFVPLFLAVDAKLCVVIGGDELAARRVKSLLQAGAKVKIIGEAPELVAAISGGNIEHVARPFLPSDLDNAAVAYCYERSEEVVRQVGIAAGQRRVPLNVADRPELCSFIAPAIIQRGALQIAISTGGASPALARILREELDQQFGAGYETLLKLIAAARTHLREREPDVERRTSLSKLMARELLVAFRDGDAITIDRILRQYAGTSSAELGVSLQCASTSPDFNRA